MPCEDHSGGRPVPDLGEPTAHVHPITMQAYFAQSAPGAGRTARQTLLLFARAGFRGTVAVTHGEDVRRFRERRLNPACVSNRPGPDPLVARGRSARPRQVVACLRCCSTGGAQRRRFQAEQRSVHDNDGPDWIQLTRTQNPVPDLVGFRRRSTAWGCNGPAHRAPSQGQRRRRQTSVQPRRDRQVRVDDRAVRDALATRVGGSGWALCSSTWRSSVDSVR